MPDTFNVPETVREAVAKAICDDDARRYDDRQETRDNFLPDAPELAEYRSNADAAIQACLKEWGALEEECGPVPELESAHPELTSANESLSRALDAFVAAYGHRITWREVLPIVAQASGFQRAFESCERCNGLGDLFNGGWKRTVCSDCCGTGRGDFRGWEFGSSCRGIHSHRLVFPWEPVEGDES